MHRAIAVHGVPRAGMGAAKIVAAFAGLSLVEMREGIVLRRLLRKAHAIAQWTYKNAARVPPELTVLVLVGGHHLLGRVVGFAQPVFDVTRADDLRFSRVSRVVTSLSRFPDARQANI